MTAAREILLPRAIVAGLLGTVLMGLFLRGLAPHLGFRKLDYPDLLARCVWGWAGLGWPGGSLAILAGWILFAVGGIVWALIYGYSVYQRLLGPGWLQGLLYGGLGVFLLTSLLLFPLFGRIHPLVRSGQLAAPGLFGWGLSGGRIVVANFLAHCLFGFVLGLVYQKRLVFSNPQKEV